MPSIKTILAKYNYPLSQKYNVIGKFWRIFSRGPNPQKWLITCIFSEEAEISFTRPLIGGKGDTYYIWQGGAAEKKAKLVNKRTLFSEKRVYFTQRRVFFSRIGAFFFSEKGHFFGIRGIFSWKRDTFSKKRPLFRKKDTLFKKGHFLQNNKHFFQ